MFLLRNSNNVPPRGFQFKDRDTGALIHANGYDLWLSKIAEHRRGNNLPPIDPSDAQDQLCSKLPPQSCSQYCQSTDPLGRSIDGVTLHWRDILRGTKTIAALKLSGSPLVSQEEANRRSAICKTCPYNVPFVNPCGGICGELLEFVTAVVGARKTEHGDSLSACAVCSCHLPAKVWIPMEILRENEPKSISDLYPASHCWMKDSA